MTTSKLKAMMVFVREGDGSRVHISRLAKSTKDLLNIVAEMNERKVAFKSQKEATESNFE